MRHVRNLLYHHGPREILGLHDLHGPWRLLPPDLATLESLTEELMKGLVSLLQLQRREWHLWFRR